MGLRKRERRHVVILVAALLALVAFALWVGGARVTVSWKASPTRNPSPTGLATVTAAPTWSPTPVTYPTIVWPTGTPTLSPVSPSPTPQMERSP